MLSASSFISGMLSIIRSRQERSSRYGFPYEIKYKYNYDFVFCTKLNNNFGSCISDSCKALISMELGLAVLNNMISELDADLVYGYRPSAASAHISSSGAA